MNRFRQIGVVVVAVALGVALGWNLPQTVPTESFGARDLFPAVQPTSTGRVLVDYGDGRMETYLDLPFTPGQNVWDLMQELERSRGVQIVFRDYGSDLGVRVTGIGDREEDIGSGYFWHYWVNQQFAQIGVSNFRLVPGDQVMWKYTTSQFKAEMK